MVSKSKVLGKSSFIFITVGSTGFQYDRLYSVLDNVLDNLKTNTQLVAQAGNSRYKIRHKNTFIYQYLAPSDLIKFIKEGSKIITHAGPVSIYLTVKYALNFPLVIPRLRKFNEHVDNHQLFFIKYLRTRLPEKLKKYFVVKGNIKQSIHNYLTETPQSNILDQYIFNELNKNNIIRQLDKFFRTTIE